MPYCHSGKLVNRWSIQCSIGHWDYQNMTSLNTYRRQDINFVVSGYFCTKSVQPCGLTSEIQNSPILYTRVLYYRKTLKLFHYSMYCCVIRTIILVYSQYTPFLQSLRQLVITHQSSVNVRFFSVSVKFVILLIYYNQCSFIHCSSVPTLFIYDVNKKEKNT